MRAAIITVSILSTFGVFCSLREIYFINKILKHGRWSAGNRKWYWL